MEEKQGADQLCSHREHVFEYVCALEYAYEPRHEKTNNLHMRKQDADQLRGDREADQRLCFRLLG